MTANEWWEGIGMVEWYMEGRGGREVWQGSNDVKSTWDAEFSYILTWWLFYLTANEAVVFVVAITQPNKTLPAPKVDVKPEEEEEDEDVKTTYQLASPVVMINTFVGKNATKLNSFTYTMHYRVRYFYVHHAVNNTSVTKSF